MVDPSIRASIDGSLWHALRKRAPAGAYYEAGSGYSTNGVALVTAIAAAFGGASGGSGESGKIFDGVNSALGGFVAGGSPDDEEPPAYLNYILFDQQYKVLDAGWTRVPASTPFSKQKVTLEAKYIKEAGYYFTYLSYEGESNNFVYFDDFKVRHVKSRLIQANEYYPFGLQNANSWTRESNVDNNFLYNGGTELNQTTQVYDLYYRNYDPVLGRFGQVDPMASKYGPVSPYHFAGNNPVVMNDPLGDEYDAFSVMDGSYVASGRGESVYRDMDPYGRNMGARIMAESIERQTWANYQMYLDDLSAFLNSLLTEPGIFSQAWNSVSNKWDGGAGSFFITDGQISGFDIWKITIAAPTSEEQLIAQTRSKLAGYGGGPMIDPIDRTPTFKELWDNYPDADENVWETIGGKVKLNHDTNPDAFSNTCAIRMSRAFNNAGYDIPFQLGETISGADGKWYIFRVSALDSYLSSTLGTPDVTGKSKKDFEGKQGIIEFKVKGWDDATGHFTLWDGKNVALGDYFNKAYEIRLWILK